MDARERIRQIERLRQSNPQEQIEAGLALIRSGDPVAIAAALEALEQPTNYHPEVISNLIGGLVDAAPATLAPVLAHLKQSPGSPGGKDCAYILGEMAYKLGPERDTCILPALLHALQVVLPEGTQAASAIVAAVRECARSGDVGEAESAMEAVLATAQSEEKPYLWTIDNALEVLYAIKGDQLLHELRTLLQGLLPAHSLTIAIEEFIDARGSI